MKTAISLLLAAGIGASCRWFDIPVPAPPRLTGALLVLALTLGYLAADNFLGGDDPEASQVSGEIGAAHPQQPNIDAPPGS